jgi:molybdate transport system substrate-binding protein
MRGRRVPPTSMLVAVALLLASACGKSSGASGEASTLTVLGASSLSKTFPQIGQLFATQHPGVSFRWTFTGTDTLAAQIEQGAPADVFAGASTTYGDELSGKGLIDAPKNFATNQLVLIVPPANPAHIASPKDLTKLGLKLVVGGPTVPVGAYTRKVLANLDASYGAGYDAKVLANVVDNEDAVAGVLQKVQLGEADAGFVYVTDAAGVGSAVTAITLPAAAQAVATYPIAAVTSSKHASLAHQFVAFVLSPPAQAILRAAKFGPPPST